jgi:ferredoxin-type protein NapH
MSERRLKTLPIIAITRKVVQFLSFFLVNYAILETIFNTQFNPLSEILAVLPFLQTARSAWTAGAGVIEYIFYSISRGTIPYLFLGILGLLGLFTGRIFCGWMCPTGFIQDLLAGLGGDNKKINIILDKSLKKVKTFLLVILLIVFIPLGIYYITDYTTYFDYSQALGDLADNQLQYFSFSEFLFVTFPNFVKYIIENQKIEGIFPNWVQWVLFFLYLILIGISVYYPRFYCRVFCPYAAGISVFSANSFLKLQRLPTRCPGRKECGVCEQVCPVQVRILDEEYDGFTGEGECYLCLDCMEKCPHNAIKWNFG